MCDCQAREDQENGGELRVTNGEYVAKVIRRSLWTSSCGHPGYFP